jgi:D-amino-acid dehydrogenase
MVRALGLRLPMQAGKGYSITLSQPIELPRICAILVEARVAVTPMNGMLRVGGTMELSGLDERINQRRVDGIVRAFARYYPRFCREHFVGLQPWRGLRPCSPDGLPYVGRTRAAENLIVATGHAMMGVSLAPITGELVAQLVDLETPRFDLTLLSPDRYA